MNKFEVYDLAIKNFGEKQLLILVEEMAELTQAIIKHTRKKPNNIAEEMADVYIMLEQVERLLNNEREVVRHYHAKIKRLGDMLGWEGDEEEDE